MNIENSLGDADRMLQFSALTPIICVLQLLRFCPDCMIGKKVRVFWPVDSSWYTGIVQKYNAETGEHLLKYDDDDTEWVRIGESAAGANQTTRGSNSPSRSSSGEQRISPIPTGMPLTGEPYDANIAWQGGNRPPFPPYSAAQGQAPPGPQPPPPHGSLPYPLASGMAAGYGFPPGGYPPSMPYGYPQHMMGMPPGSMPPGVGSSSRIGKGRGIATDGGVSPTPSDLSARKKNGPRVWTKEEDTLLLSLVQGMRMPMKWSVVAQSIQGRTGKQCRERYVNHLNPRLKTCDWSPVEDATVFHLYTTSGSHWAKMAKMIPGRTDNGIKNRFHNLRRQLEREDEHRLRLSKAKDFPEEIRLDHLRPFPEHMKGKADDLWDMNRGLGVLAAQSVLGGGIARNSGRYGPFRTPEQGEFCGRCGLLVPSVQCGDEICTKTGWCRACTKIPPHISANLLRECLNLRRCQDKKKRDIVESWEDPFVTKEGIETV